MKKWPFITFNNCNLGNLAAKKLDIMSCNNLRYLGLVSDCIANRGFKKLVKWLPSEMSYLALVNTNISPDCIKLLRKGMKPAFNSVNIPDYNMNFFIFKEITYLRVRSIPEEP